MIHPSIYSFNAALRGPKHSKEVNKLFTSIIYDICMAYNELEQEAAVIPNNLKFCISGDVEPFVKFATAGKINGVDYAYRCLDVKPNSGAKAELGLSQLVNSMRSRLDQILENI